MGNPHEGADPAGDGPASALGDDSLAYTDDGIEATLDLPNPESEIAASYDALFLVGRLARHHPPARIDIHTFAYLACLMSVYDGQPAHEWGYSFSAVPPTLPYSPTLDGAVRSLLEAKYIAPSSSSDASELAEFELTSEGRNELDFLSGLSLLASRLQFLEAATSAAVFTSTAAVVNSLANEPQLAAATKLNSSRQLLTASSTTRLYAEFDALSRAIGKEDVNLILPASMYVNYLQSVARKAIDEATSAEVTSD